MLRRMIVLGLVLGLAATAAVAQDEPEAAPLRPCLLAGGRTYVPVAFVAGIPGLDAQEPVMLDGVPMIPVAAAIKAAGGSASITYDLVYPEEVVVPAAVQEAATRAWCEKHCTWRTLRCPGPGGWTTCKVMTCRCGPPPVQCMLEPCSKKACPFCARCVRVLVLQAGGQELRFEAMTPGVFWKQDSVRGLIHPYRRQPVPRWPYVDTTFPKHAPFGVNWRRPYLDWKPDESWLMAHIQPVPEEAPAPPTPAAGAEPAAEPAEAGPAPATTPPPVEPGPAPDLMGPPEGEPMP
jgi:hypothetical protein